VVVEDGVVTANSSQLQALRRRHRDRSPGPGRTRRVDRVTAAWPTATLVHLPLHASWLDPVEIYFSILQRKALSPDDFRDLDHLAERVLAFEERHNHAAEPFDWTSTRDDLIAFLRRLGNQGA
jgi:hypothetical protein